LDAAAATDRDATHRRCDATILAGRAVALLVGFER
jgi:hypothetical protein